MCFDNYVYRSRDDGDDKKNADDLEEHVVYTEEEGKEEVKESVLTSHDTVLNRLAMVVDNRLVLMEF